MAYRPLHIACGVLIIALSLTATLAVTMTDFRSAPSLAGETGTEVDAVAPSPATSEIAAADESPYFPAATTAVPFPNDRLLTVLDDGPVRNDGRLLPVSTGSGSVPPRPSHRGYEELPPPPDAVPQLAAAEVPNVESPLVPPPATTPAPLQELVSELSKLREDLHNFGEAAHGHSAVQSEMHSLRTEIAGLHERHERDRLDDIQRNVDRIAQQQEELASQIENKVEAPVPVPDPTPEVVPTPPPVVDSAPPAVDIQPVEGVPERWSAQLQAAAPGDVVRRLSEVGHWNLVLHSAVREPITLSLSSVTADELLQAVAAALDCGIVDDGAVRIVLPAPLAAARRAAAEQTVARLIRPSFISATDVLPLIRPMLTPGVGEVALTLEGGADDAPLRRAQSDAILLVDYQTVVSQVEAMLGQVDLPPEQFVIEAVLTTVVWNERTQHGVVSALEQAGVCSAPLRRDRVGSTTRPARVAQCSGTTQDVLQALSLVGDVRIESTPTLHVLNRQLAEVQVGANVAYREQSAWGRRLRLVEEEVEFLPSRTALSVRPFLQGDNTVRLQVHPRVSFLHDDAATGLPREEVAELSTDLTIPLGCTAVIGGLTQSSQESYTGSSPMSRWFGRRSRSSVTSTNGQQTVEVVVLLTPRRACDVESQPAVETTPATANEEADYISPTGVPVGPLAPGPELPVIRQEPQPVAAPPLLERLLGQRSDAPDPDRSRSAGKSLSDNPPPFPEVPPPRVLSTEPETPEFAWETRRVREEPAAPLMPPAPADESETQTETQTEIEVAVVAAPSQELPSLAPVAMDAVDVEVSGTLQTSAEIEVFDPVPPQPAAPQPAVAPLPTLAAVDQHVVPPPPPEMVVAPVLTLDPETYVPPAPIGRARRRVERAERHDSRIQRDRRAPDMLRIPPAPRP